MAVKRYALCLRCDFGDEFDGGDVFPGMAYECLGTDRGMLRVVDESGEDYLYPIEAFRVLSDDDSQVLGESLGKVAA